MRAPLLVRCCSFWRLQIGQTYTPQNENGWTIGYHSKLYNLTDQALGACPPDTTWALVTNGDNIYEPAFFQQLATVGQSADVVAFDYYSRHACSPLKLTLLC